MANPQLENGYTSIANEILEKLISNRFTSQELRIILFVIRKTYGFHKKVDFISLTQIANAIDSCKIRCSQIVKRLELMKILTVNENINGIGKSYIFNKNFDAWRGVNKNINGIEKYKRRVNKNINGGVNKNINHKRKSLKKVLNINNIVETFSTDSVEYKLSLYLFDFIKKRNPNHKKPDLQKWSKHIDLMIRRDNRDPCDIKKVIQWCQINDFWQNNILSTKKLRMQYDQLMLKMKNKPKDNETLRQEAIEEYYKKHPEERIK